MTHKVNLTMLAAIGHTDNKGKSGMIFNQALLPKMVHLAQTCDGLMKVRVYIGDAVATAIIDTGSQLNLISDRKFWESGLVCTEESSILFTGTSGGGNMCIGSITDVEIFVSANHLRMLGPDLHMLEKPPFQALLG